MVEYILDDTPKTPFLIKHYVVIYYLLVIFGGVGDHHLLLESCGGR
nr:MAG TPA: hypothetical protein [Bacteriophage sp.]